LSIGLLGESLVGFRGWGGMLSVFPVIASPDLSGRGNPIG